LWYCLNDPSLSATARAVIDDPINDILVSPITLWEIAIKMSIGKYSLGVPYEAFLRASMETNQFDMLPIELRHTAALLTMPFHHKDPFDRLLIAQAMVEGIPIISADQAFSPYNVICLW